MATPKLDAQAGKLNIVIEQGATFNPVLTYSDAVGDPIDLTGYDARMQIRLKKSDPDPPADELTVTNGGIVLGGAAGTITLIMTDTATAAITYKSAVYDLEIISGSGIVTRLVEGGVSVSKEPTR